MKISVITACFNSQKTIAEAIESLKRQSWPFIEHLVIDGASQDASVAIASKTLGDGDVLISEPDRGIFDALNKGLQRASGDVIGFLNSDDLFAHDNVLRRVAACFNDPNVGAVYGDLQYVDADDTERVIRYWKSGTFSRRKLQRGWMPPHPSFFMRREFYEDLGGFDPAYRISGDYDSLLRYLGSEMFSVVYLPEVLVKMRVGGASNGSLKAILRKSSEDIKAMRNNGVNPLIALPYKNFSKLPQFLGVRGKGDSA
ncbi:glycosyltransferase family 2 protein [Vreelandella sedimenti]|jgi:glycosyltransferase|uniref:glycosyltransferase family 2 protein n=1 Tax=Vreelandella sedimenti TaxID=2729618 RepID=UPI002580A89C|nr:glycosyltransferase family 2 protein [Halomonas sp. UBA3173]|tara:strand:+ start:27300 stop:28067 length:768 start_codon:yes stop_codon:yes gene_type:complete